jgi:hypothetical protein
MNELVSESVRHVRERLEAAQHHLDDVAHERVDGDRMVWAARLERAARSLRRAIIEHRELAESANGQLAELIAEKPSLADQVSAQAHEHVDLMEISDALAASCRTAIAFEDPNVELLQLDGQILALQTKRHITWESVLYYEAFFQEEGGEEG